MMDGPVPGLRVLSTEPHLGGYIAGGDPATYYPALWAWLMVRYPIASVVDVGCGDGVALREFAKLGCTVTGVDGVPQKDSRVITHDYTRGKLGGLPGFDLVWSCEFVEHVEERFLPNVLDTFQRAPLVVMTHAAPGQLGHHHVNCQPAEYWLGVMAAIGYGIDWEATWEARAQAARNEHPQNHFRRSGMVFRRSAT